MAYLHSLLLLVGVMLNRVRYGEDINDGKRVALKIVDLSRFRDDTVSLMVKEVTQSSLNRISSILHMGRFFGAIFGAHHICMHVCHGMQIRIMKMLKHRHCIRILDVKENVPYTGIWCDQCACSSYQDSGDDEGTCRQCSHPAINHADAPETRDVLLMVQELAAGGELFGLLMHCGPFPEEVARLYFRQLIEGLEYCHSQGVCHRDLKPENLVLDAHFQLKIVDFGLASFCGGDRAVLHSGVGSQPYSAPEVYYSRELYGGSGYRGESADIWSTAVILYVMLTGRPPFVRPLLKNYGNLKKCKHFVNLMRGASWGHMSDAASNLLTRVFQLNPSDRPSIAQIKADPWYNGSIPVPETVVKVMEEKSRSVWSSLAKVEMVDVLTKIRFEYVASDLPGDLPSATSTPLMRPSSPPATPSHSHILAPSTPHRDDHNHHSSASPMASPLSLPMSSPAVAPQSMMMHDSISMTDISQLLPSNNNNHHITNQLSSPSVYRTLQTYHDHDHQQHPMINTQQTILSTAAAARYSPPVTPHSAYDRNECPNPNAPTNASIVVGSHARRISNEIQQGIANINYCDDGHMAINSNNNNNMVGMGQARPQQSSSVPSSPAVDINHGSGGMMDGKEREVKDPSLYFQPDAQQVNINDHIMITSDAHIEQERRNRHRRDSNSAHHDETNCSSDDEDYDQARVMAMHDHHLQQQLQHHDDIALMTEKLQHMAMNNNADIIIDNDCPPL